MMMHCGFTDPASPMISPTSVDVDSWIEPACGADPLRAEPYLQRGLLARNVEGAEEAGHLERQRRFADAGLAPDQYDRSGNDAAAAHQVELADPGLDPVHRAELHA